MIFFDIAYKSNKGGRERNQDYLAYATTGTDTCLVACDGLGSYDGSEIISSLCADTIVESFKRSVDENSAEAYSVENCRQIMLEAQNVLLEQKKRVPELKDACTTMACVITNKEKSFLVHIGDTRIYLFKDGKLFFQTRDHSLAQYAVDRGDITLKEVRTHKDQNKLTRVMGSDYYIPPDIDIYSEPIKQGDAFVLCTDGYWEYIFEDELQNILENSATSDEALLNLQCVLENRVDKYNDNFSIIIAVAREGERDIDGNFAVANTTLAQQNANGAPTFELIKPEQFTQRLTKRAAKKAAEKILDCNTAEAETVIIGDDGSIKSAE